MRLRDDPFAKEAQAALKRALGQKTALVVATAAEVVGDGGVTELLGDVAAAFARFTVDGLKTDPTSRAKKAILKALHSNEWTESEPYLTAISYVQLEPSWGPPEDSAGELRAVAAVALAQLRHPRIFDLLAKLLLDPERVARIGAARALGDTGSREAVPLLRYKSYLTDPEPEVVTECFLSLLHLEPEESFAFVSSFLTVPDEATQEAAAIALGQSKMPQAAKPLVRWAAGRLQRDRSVAYVALALLRSPEALDYLLGRVQDGEEADASLALDALAVHRHDPKLAARVAEVVDARGSEAIAAHYRQCFS